VSNVIGPPSPVQLSVAVNPDLGHDSGVTDGAAR
jgi:hypothetical protein